MRAHTFLAALVLGLLLGGPVVALGWRAWNVRRESRQEETSLLVFDRVDHTVTQPPDYNVRASYGIDPRFRVKKRHEDEVKRLLEFHRPAIRDAFQGILTRIHYTVLDRGEGRDSLERQCREAVNRILGAEFVVRVEFANFQK